MTCGKYAIGAAIVLLQLSWSQAALLTVEVNGRDSGGCVSSPCITLSYAIQMANSGDTIEMGPGTYPAAGNSNLDPGAANKADLTIRGRAGREQTIIDVNGMGRFMWLSTAAGRTFVQGFTIKNVDCSKLEKDYKVGGGFVFWKSNASIDSITISNIACDGGTNASYAISSSWCSYCGGGLYLSGSYAHITNVIVSDAVGSFGTGITTVRDDHSIIEDSLFTRIKSSMWGGIIIADQDTHATFNRCTFSHVLCNYGGVLDDGGESDVVFRDCTFEYAKGIYGAVYYAYQKTRLRFINSRIQHNIAVKGAVYITNGPVPYFENVTFFNNTGEQESAAVMSYNDGTYGVVLFKDCKFVGNKVLSGGSHVIAAQSNIQFEGCRFQDNDGALFAGALALTSHPSNNPVVINNCVFDGNNAYSGGAIKLNEAGADASKPQPQVIVTNTIFVNNAAGLDGGAICHVGTPSLYMRNVTFRGNTAGGKGAAIQFAGRTGFPMVSTTIIGSVFDRNIAQNDGGALQCQQSPGYQVNNLTMIDVRVQNNIAYGNGGGIAVDCSLLKFTRVNFTGNVAQDNNGGGLSIAKTVEAAYKGTPLFDDLTFVGNNAALSGGAVFFSFPSPLIAIPTYDNSVWNKSVASPWIWSNFDAMVKENTAHTGPLQATAPVKLQAFCPDGNPCTVSASSSASYAGYSPLVRVSLLDSFNQADVDSLLSLQVLLAPGPYVTNGLKAYRGDDTGVFTVDSTQILVAGTFINASASKPADPVASFIIRLPPADTEHANVPPLIINYTMFQGQSLCPVGSIASNVYKTSKDSTSQGPLVGWGCEPCLKGQYGILGASSCTACAEGFYADQEGSSACKSCPAGYSCPVGASLAVACDAGKYALAQKAECLYCLPGTYQSLPGKSACISCDTVIVGASCGQGTQKPSDCACPKGSLLRSFDGNSSVCAGCPAGMRCPGGALPAEQLGGYYAYVKDNGQIVRGSDVRRLSTTTWQYNVVLCRSDIECPAGPAGTCAFGRGGLACNDCLPNYFEERAGTCAQCTQSIQGPLIFALFFTLALAVAGILLVKLDLSRQSLSVVTVGALGAQLAFAVQALGAVRQMKIGWVDPIKAILDVFVLINFNYEIINFSCIWEHSDPVIRFLLKILTYPACASALIIAYWASKLIGRSLDVNKLYNLNGMLLSVFYITLTLGVLLPFQCQSNPDGSRSMLSEPALMCFKTPKHVTITILAAFGIFFYPVSIYAWIVWVTIRFPSLIASGKGIQMVVRYKFLFNRYKPEVYYYGVLSLTRGMIVALLPVVVVGVPSLQVVLMGAVFLYGALVQTRLWPWRTYIANICDLAISSFLVLIMLAAGPLMLVSGRVLNFDEEKNQAEKVMSILMTVLVVFVLFAFLASGVYVVYRRFRPRYNFGAFLCHHKVGAGVLCRFIKSIVSKHSTSEMFVDSDNLMDLDLLFNMVRTETKNLVIVMTPEVLKRMWCAGEIATAFSNKVHMLPMVCDGCMPPDDATIETIPLVWTEEMQATLVSFGITMELIKEAYRHLRTLPYMEMSRFASFEEQEATVLEMMSRCKLPRNFLTEQSKASETASIVITGNVSDAEALSTCRVIQMIVQKDMQLEVQVVRNEEEAWRARPHCQYLIVVLHKGILENPKFAQILMIMKDFTPNDAPMTKVMSSTSATMDLIESMGKTGGYPKNETFTVNSDITFQFPNLEFYTKIEQEGLGLPHLGLGPDEGPKLRECYFSMMKVLALPLTSHGSKTLIEQQVMDLTMRMRTRKRKSEPSTEKVDKEGRVSIQTEESRTNMNGAREDHSEVEFDRITSM